MFLWNTNVIYLYLTAKEGHGLDHEGATVSQSLGYLLRAVGEEGGVLCCPGVLERAVSVTLCSGPQPCSCGRFLKRPRSEGFLIRPIFCLLHLSFMYFSGALLFLIVIENNSNWPSEKCFFFSFCAWVEGLLQWLSRLLFQLAALASHMSWLLCFPLSCLLESSRRWATLWSYVPRGRLRNSSWLLASQQLLQPFGDWTSWWKILCLSSSV